MNFVTIQEAFAKTGVSINTIYGWISARQIQVKYVEMVVGTKKFQNRLLVDLDEVVLMAKRSKKGVKFDLPIKSIIEAIEKTEPKTTKTPCDSVWNRARRELAALRGEPVGEKAVWDPKAKGWAK